ncbi:MAG: diacylglycerol kinase family protein [Opitutaceae bacterium]
MNSSHRHLKIHFIVNPQSGRAVASLEAVRSFARKHGATVSLTERTRHASDLTRAALNDSANLIVAVGGDGTMNEVAGTLVNSGATFGLIPCGSGNGLGRHLGIHGSIDRALQLLIAGCPRCIDSGVANGRPFFVVAGLGFEAEIAERFNRLSQRGFWRYLTTSARAWRQSVPLSCSVNYDRHHEHVRAFTLAVANTDQYGNNARIAPGARVDDGLLDLTVVPPVTLLSAVPLLTRLFSGRLAPPAVWRRQAAGFVVDGLSAGLVLHTDGETQPAGERVAFSVQPASLRIMVPAKA